jgi:PAS domain S-box-containing protein
MRRDGAPGPLKWLGTRHVRTYLLVVVIAFIGLGFVGTIVVSVESHHTAVGSAAENTSEAAQTAGLAAQSTLSGFVSTLTSLADTPEGTSGLDLSDCHAALVTISKDIVGGQQLTLASTSGQVLCTSAATPKVDSYEGAPWLKAASTKAANFGPYRDPLSGTQALVTTAPIAGSTLLVVESQPLAPFGAELAGFYSGTNHLNFMITSADNKTIISSSTSSNGLVGVPVSHTKFSARGAPSAARDGVTGVSNFFSQVTVPTLGWHIWVGEPAATALGSYERLRTAMVWILIFGIGLLVLVLIFAYRMVTSPLFKLTRGLAIPEGRTTPEPVAIAGPVEVAAIATGINTLIEEVDSELARRRAAEDAARESSQSYQTLFEANPLPMVLIEAETLRFIDVNNAAIAAYGYRWDEFKRLSATDLWASDDSGIADSIRRGDPVNGFGPVRHVRKDGTVVRVLITSRTITFEGKDARFSLYEDVTERERLLRSAQQSQRLESLGQLAGGVAHDFNNLLAVIGNYAEFVKENPTVSADVDAVKDIDQIIRATGRAAELTKDLLRFARREMVQPRSLDVKDAVHAVEVMLQRTLGEHITLRTDLAEGPSTIVADPGQFELVLVNLAVNARDAMVDGGTLTIAVEPHHVHRGSLEPMAGLAPGEYVVVSVSDSGGGMNDEVRARAFEPFFTTKEKGKGTGLGLSTVYGIVTAAEGHISIESDHGQGTTVTMVFPASEHLAGEEDAEHEPDYGKGMGRRVVVVDDEPAIGTLVERILRGAGYLVDTATSGAEGLSLINALEEPLDLLLSDMVMPEMSGVELAWEVRSRRPATKVLFMSGYAEPVLDTHEALPPGLELLTKPFNEEELLAKVAHVLAEAPTPLPMGDGGSRD